MSEFMHTFPVRRVISHHDGLKSFRFDRVLEAEPGQFVLLWLPGVDEKPFALSGVFDRELEITVKAVGPFTQALMGIQPGDYLGLRGPFGTGFTLQDNLLLIGGGIGNAPLRFLAQRLREKTFSFRWIAAVKTAQDLPFRDELLIQTECFPVSEDGSIGKTGRGADFLKELHADEPASALCASGPEPLLLATHRFAREASPEIPVQLSFERYMKCAVGLCGQCCLDGSGLRVCVEGPVLNARQISQVQEWGKPHRGPSGRRSAP
jgi:dihydroorotate dehydrogenase electron transfer subunit